ncbi:MAG: hypothetical protein ABI361_09420 [Nitrososphaera sp.]|jgi:hypothetical protein
MNETNECSAFGAVITGNFPGHRCGDCIDYRGRVYDMRVYAEGFHKLSDDEKINLLMQEIRDMHSFYERQEANWERARTCQIQD